MSEQTNVHLKRSEMKTNIQWYWWRAATKIGALGSRIGYRAIFVAIVSLKREALFRSIKKARVATL